MKNQHFTFLKPFFESMNENFIDKWCVLHSYETLPNFSESDVDMALNHSDVTLLESLILKVANNTGWTVCQKLWYDVPKCFYYVLRDNKEGTFLAIDFLMDPKGIGRYGFNTETLTSNCKIHEDLFPIPDHSVAFTYKLVKRIVKKRSMLAEKDYLLQHLKKSDRKVVREIIIKQFGENGNEIIKPKLEANDFEFTTSEIAYLIKLKNRNFFFKLKPFLRLYWEVKRISNRFLKPKGLIINVPILSETDLNQFKLNLEQKVGLLFRFVKLNQTPFFLNNLKGLVGSTLVINSKNNFSNDAIFKSHWLFGSEDIKIESADFENVDRMVDAYFHAILNVLINRKNLA